MKAPRKLAAASALALASVIAAPAHAGGLIESVTHRIGTSVIAGDDTGGSLSEFCANSQGTFGPGPLAPIGSACVTPVGPGVIVIGPHPAFRLASTRPEYGISGRKGCVVPMMTSTAVWARLEPPGHLISHFQENEARAMDIQ